MIPVTAWTPEFCTVCDKECMLGSVYCSDECRESDFQESESADVYSTGSPHSTHLSAPEHDSTDSSEDEDAGRSLHKALCHEPPHVRLHMANSVPMHSNVNHGGSGHANLGSSCFINGNAVGKPNQARPKKKEFLYASPVLKPAKAPTISPSMSPLLIPQAVPQQEQKYAAQSMNTYKRWLADSGNH